MPLLDTKYEIFAPSHITCLLCLIKHNILLFPSLKRQGFTYNSEFYQARDRGDLDVSMVGSNKQNLDMLFNDRVDVFMEFLKE